MWGNECKCYGSLILASDVGFGKRLNGGQQSGEGVNADLAVSMVAKDVVK